MEVGKVIYLLEATTICGGVKVVFEHVRFLCQKNIDAKIISKQPYPDWINYTIPFKQINSFDEVFAQKNSVFILTFFEHILTAQRHGVLNRCIHFCQGYEGDYKEAKNHLHLIEMAYKIPIKRITVSKKLSDYLYSKFRVHSHVVGQAIDHNLFYPGKDVSPCPPYKVILMGSFFNSVKNVVHGLQAINIARQRLPIELTRISLSDTLEQEDKICPIDKYLMFLKPEQVADIMRMSHLVVVPSSKGEGFGLPVIEAMACGLPVIMTDIPSFREITENKYPLPLVPVGDIDKMASVIIDVLQNREKYVQAKNMGLLIARKYTYDRVINRLIKLL